jgi:outer membrane immunogenic protein
MLKKLVLAAAATIGAISISSAADMPVKARPVLPVAYYDWSGFYVGAFVGGIWGETGTFLSGSGVPIKVDADGIYAGVLAGYDWQLPNRVVLGVRVAAPFGTTADGRTADPTFPATVFHDADLRWALLFTGNIGLAMGDGGRWLPYVGGGLAVGEGKATFISPGTGTLTDKHTHTGFTVLAGVRYAFANNWWGAVQYNYTDFGSETYNLGAPRTIDFTSHSVTGMLVYKWGGPVVARY